MARVRFTSAGPMVCSLLVALGLGAAPYLTAEADLTSKLLDTELSRVNKVSQLPQQLALAVSDLLGGQALADPEHLQRSAAPARSADQPHLIFAAKSPTLWAVHFSRGKKAGGYELAIFKINPNGEVVAKTHLVSTERAWSIPNLKNMLRQGQFKSAEVAQAR